MNYAVVRQPPMGIKYSQSTPMQSVCVEVLEVGALHCINGLLCEPAGWLTGRVSLFTALTVPDVANYPDLPSRTWYPINDAQRSLLTMCWVKTQHLTHSRKS